MRKQPTAMKTIGQKIVEQSKDECISVPEAASLLRLSEKSIRRLLTEKRLTRFKVGVASVKSRTLLLRSEVVALIHKA